MIRKLAAAAIILGSMAFTPPRAENKRIEVVFCLDLSGSTNGLLEDIRDNLWHFINTAKKENPAADLRIGLVGFSRPSFGAKSDYVSILSNLTDRFDMISLQLFRLTVSVEKGDQFVASALYTAINQMNWTHDGKTEKVILLFGNGRVDAGRFDFREVCDKAVLKDIVVYPVYLSRLSINSNDLAGWYAIAEITGGAFSTLQLERRTPQKFNSEKSDKLLDLNNNLNDTYVHFTREGDDAYEAMIAADISSAQMHEQFFYGRCRYKISQHYQDICKGWDLVSRMQTEPGIISELNRKFLPQQLQQASANALQQVLKIKSERRKFILERMRESLNDIQPDSISLNPVDSVFYTSLKRHL